MTRTFGELESLGVEDDEPPPSRPTLPWRDEPPWMDPVPASVRGRSPASTPASRETMRLPNVRPRNSSPPPSSEAPTAPPAARISTVPPSSSVRTHPPPSTRAPQVVTVEEVVLAARDPRVDD